MTEAEIKFNNYTNLLTEYVMELKRNAGDKMLQELSDKRKFSMKTIKEQQIFYIGEATEMLIPKYYEKLDDLGVISPTNKKPIFHNRYIMPIFDTDNRVLNIVGYSGEEDERYVYGTAKYYRRRETMHGLENLDYAYDIGFAILTEGITDKISVIDLGHKNTFATCGTHDSSFIIKQLNRCRYGVIKIPDRDFAGQKAESKWDCNRSITLNTFIKYKDIDQMIRESQENRDWVESYINVCIKWITQAEHRGFKCPCEKITIY